MYKVFWLRSSPIDQQRLESANAPQNVTHSDSDRGIIVQMYITQSLLFNKKTNHDVYKNRQCTSIRGYRLSRATTINRNIQKLLYQRFMRLTCINE